MTSRPRPRLSLPPLAVFLGVLAVAVCQQATNPFLAHKRQILEQQQQRVELQQLQHRQSQLDLDASPPQEPQPPSLDVRRSQESDRKPPRDSRPRPVDPERRRGQQGGRSGGGDGGRYNRNEMHDNDKGAVWTRWTSKPQQRGSPWDSNGRKGLDNALCESQRYNPREQICCDGNLHRRQGLRPACCEEVAFDLVFNVCCKGKVTSRTTGKEFC